MNYSSLDDVWGGGFQQRKPVTMAQTTAKEHMENPPHKPDFTPVGARGEASVDKHKQLLASVTKTLPLDGSTQGATLGPPPPPIPPVMGPSPTHRQGNNASIPAPTTYQEHFGMGLQDYDVSDKLSRILRLIEQNRTGYERPGIQDMVLYVATGVFFLFTFDTFVQMGKTMRRY